MTEISHKIILIVEDDTECRDYVADVLGHKYPLRFASNGDEGLAMARRAHPGLILLDVMMPGGMNGLQVLCELKREAGTRSIPVIMMTGINTMTGLTFDKEIVGNYLGMPEAFLEKPLDASSLLAAVSKVLD